MTLSHKPSNNRFKPLQLGLASILFSSLSLITAPVYSAPATPGPSDTVTTTPIQNKTPAMSSTEVSSTTTSPANPAPVANGQISPDKAPSTTTATDTTTVSSPAVDTTTTGPANPNAPIEQPNMPDNQILDLSLEVAKDVYSYDFRNYNHQLQQNQHFFTPQGWKAFMTALDNSNNLTIVQNRKLVASATPTGRPVLLKKGVRNGVYTWEVQLPLLVTYENESRLIKQNLMVTMLLVRANTPSGVGVSHFVATIIPSTTPVSQNVTGTTSTTSTTTAPVTITTPGATTTTTVPATTGVTTGTTGVTSGTTGTTTTVTPGTTTGVTGAPGVGTTPATGAAITTPSTTSPGLTTPATGTTMVPGSTGTTTSTPHTTTGTTGIGGATGTPGTGSVGGPGSATGAGTGSAGGAGGSGT